MRVFLDSAARGWTQPRRTAILVKPVQVEMQSFPSQDMYGQGLV
jgi:hypothetical protein